MPCDISLCRCCAPELRAPGAPPLAGADGNVCAVADDDQLIYSWGGAEPRNVLAFADPFPGHARIVLGRNLRCRAEILDAAVACVAHNEHQAAKALIAVRGAGGHVRVLRFTSEHHEAHWIAGTIADALAAGVAPTEVLVLARSGYASQPVQSALARMGIPHRVLGSLGLYERSEVRDALAYLALLANPADAQAFRRAVQAPRRGVGTATATANRIIALAREQHGRSELETGRSIGHVVVATVMLDSGLVAHYQQRRDHSPRAELRRDAERVLEDLRSLCRAAQTYDEQHPDTATLTGLLEHAAGLHAQELKPGQEDRRITRLDDPPRQGHRSTAGRAAWGARNSCCPPRGR
jgi:DNA helicase II / ATP-dependent DNA helicase PcrA